MIKLIATDLDGTLLYPKKKLKLIIKKNIEFLQDYINDGNRVVVVSGRNFPIAKRLMKKLKTRIDMIACNGSAIFEDGKIVSEYPISYENIIKIYQENINNKDIISWIFMTDKSNMIIVPNKKNIFFHLGYRLGMILQFKYQGNYLFGEKYFLEMLKNKEEKIYKAMCIYGLGKKGVEKATKFLPIMNEKYGNTFEIVQSHESLEFMNKGINKASGLLEYIDNNNININEVAVVGDSGNDVPLFEIFPHSFVMMQARKEVKNKANTIINGVYEIKEYLNNKKIKKIE